MNILLHKFKLFTFVLLFMFSITVLNAANISSTSAGGNWSETTTWVGGVVPSPNDNVTVVSGSTIILDTNIVIGTGIYTFNGNVTDNGVHTLTATNTSGQLIISNNSTTTFGGSVSWNGSTITVNAGSSLIVGELTIGNGTTVNIAGSLFVNGNLTDSNNGSGIFSVTGYVQVYGNYSAPVGSVEVTGSGIFQTTGTIITTGSSEVNYCTNNCTVGPCSSATICCGDGTNSYTSSVSPNNQVLCSGQTVSSLVFVTNAPGVTSYQWQFSTTNGGTGFRDITGATSSSYTPPQPTVTTWYRIKYFTSSCGGPLISPSSQISLSNDIPPIVGVIGGGNVSYCSNTNSTPMTLSGYTATGFQWQSSVDNVTFVNISGATSDSYTATNVISTTYYRVVVSNGLCNTDNSSSVAITRPPTVGIPSVPTTSATTICQGSANTSYTTLATNATSYNWSVTGTGNTISGIGTTGTVTWASGFTGSATISVTAIGCGTSSTASTTVTINALSVAPTGASGATTICNGESIILTVSGGSAGTGAIAEWFTGSCDGTLAGTGNSISVSPSSTTTYFVRYNGICNTTTCGSVAVTVNELPAAPTGTTELSFCSGLSPKVGNLSALGTGIQWYAASSGGTALTTFTDLVNGAHYYASQTVNGCESASRFDVGITINTTPEIPTAFPAQPTCVVSTGTITVTAPTGMSYSIDGSNYSNTTGVFNNVAVGSYTVTAKNAFGCTSSSSAPIAIIPSVTNTWDGTKWSKTGDTTPPIINDLVVFNADYPPITSQFNACSCQIKTGANVKVGVLNDANADAILKIENGLDVAVGGSLTFENNASLIQVNDVDNTGKIIYKRITTPMNNFDFTYWSSPVKGQTAKLLSPNTLWDKYFRYDGSTNNWVFDDGEMIPGVGFIIRTPKPGVYGAPYPETVEMPYRQPVSFIGVPNNGEYRFAVGAGEFNLIGNPYPSALDADKFMEVNASVIGGALYFWTHKTPIKQEGDYYVYSSEDYATYTLMGGVGTKPAASGGITPNGKIAAGQSFFVSSNESASGEFVFNNLMRNTDKVLVSDSNSQFFRMSKTKKMAGIEKDRVWLNLSNLGGAFKQLLVGYATGATNEMDKLYDGITLDANPYVDFYSVNNGNNLAIQGRALPFEQTDQVPLGYKTTIQGDFTINIDNADGALVNQDIFIEDKVAGVIVNLKNGPYAFTTTTGIFNNRFVLRFMTTSNTSKITSKVASDTTDKSVLVSVKNKQITINAQDEVIDKVLVYDLKTSLLYEKENVNTNEFAISNFNSGEQFLIVQVLLKNGKWVTKEIIF